MAPTKGSARTSGKKAASKGKKSAKKPQPKPKSAHANFLKRIKSPYRFEVRKLATRAHQSIRSDAVRILDSLVKDTFQKIASGATDIQTAAGKRTITPRVMLTSAKVFFYDGDLKKDSINHAKAALTRFQSFKRTKGAPKVSKTKQAGLIFSVSKVHRKLKQGFFAPRISGGAAVVLAAVLERIVGTIISGTEPGRQISASRVVESISEHPDLLQQYGEADFAFSIPLQTGSIELAHSKMNKLKRKRTRKPKKPKKAANKANKANKAKKASKAKKAKKAGKAKKGKAKASKFDSASDFESFESFEE